ncbi:hypothetical protein PHAVU_006G018400 [Phaseolus vulgaris]|uniref:Endonuclease/exonuclease/phosphatase domain-containing protein n=1 Tax=Phaseolus vulgaris TaxID=3885 RepID=V7BJJ2_PHAVU|nr:hypothetical protein PHAVU_006G018400g [Phaseolus vulgaris]ESW18164.1 hypothetical protein PHAVU_006G018400g [Phaseolus vulgaris]
MWEDNGMLNLCTVNGVSEDDVDAGVATPGAESPKVQEEGELCERRRSNTPARRRKKKGLGGGTKARYIRQIIACEGAEFVCLQETKSKVLSEAKCFSLWGNNKIGWLHYDGDNGSGSLLSMWYKESFSYLSHMMGKGFIVVYGKHIKYDISCAVVNVYATCNLREKKMLWEKLSSINVASQKVGISMQLEDEVKG